MSEIVSKGAFAIRLGRMPSAVSNWIAREKIWGPALTADGRIVVDEALRQLGMTIDPGRGRPDLAKPTIPAPSPEEDPDTLAQVRLAREKLALEAQQRAAAVERGDLVRAEEVSRLWAAELGDLILAVEQFVIDLPPKLSPSLGRDAVDIARREFRAFRARRAEQAAVVAAAAESGRAA